MQCDDCGGGLCKKCGGCLKRCKKGQNGCYCTLTFPPP